MKNGVRLICVSIGKFVIEQETKMVNARFAQPRASLIKQERCANNKARENYKGE